MKNGGHTSYTQISLHAIYHLPLPLIQITEILGVYYYLNLEVMHRTKGTVCSIKLVILICSVYYGWAKIKLYKRIYQA